MKKLQYPFFASVVLTVMLLSLLGYTPAASASDKPMVLIQASWGPTKMPPPLDWDPFDFALSDWMNTIEQQTKGRIKLKRYPAETLAKVTDPWDLAKGGICGIALVGVPNAPWPVSDDGSPAASGLFR